MANGESWTSDGNSIGWDRGFSGILPSRKFTLAEFSARGKNAVFRKFAEEWKACLLTPEYYHTLLYSSWPQYFTSNTRKLSYSHSQLTTILHYWHQNTIIPSFTAADHNTSLLIPEYYHTLLYSSWPQYFTSDTRKLSYPPLQQLTTILHFWHQNTIILSFTADHNTSLLTPEYYHTLLHSSPQYFTTDTRILSYPPYSSWPQYFTSDTRKLSYSPSQLTTILHFWH